MNFLADLIQQLPVDVYILDLLVIGLLLLVVTLGSGWISRMPLNYAVIYLIVGVLLGPYGLELIDLRVNALFLQRFSEFIVIVSVFNCGLKMNRPLQLWRYETTARLIGFLMPITILAIAGLGRWLLGLSWGAGILLGAILSPTDPVLASEVQLDSPEDRDELRFSLTSEGGVNDSAAFPFVYFGLYSLEDPNWQTWFRNWVLIDLVWAIAAALVMGVAVAQGIVWLDRRLQRVRNREEVVENFIALSAILLTYGLTEVINGYGFLAVFVAGVAMRQFYQIEPEKRCEQLRFTEQVEKLLEVGIILLLGTLLLLEPLKTFAGQGLLVAGLLFLVIRPLGVWLSLWGSPLPVPTNRLLGWFGIRGVSSIYYLSYALAHGLRDRLGEQIAWITYIVVVLSIIIHGISATPLMNWYERRRPGLSDREKTTI